MKIRNYKENELLKLAKRYNNKKRTYLLVNPLQAKHIPVRPSESLEMMKQLGAKLYSKYANTKLIIGFAETATAIAACVASCFNDSLFIHTTRESLSDVKEWIDFSEEHSHAVEQKLSSETLNNVIDKTETIIFIDDELSTGKTMINIVEKLRTMFPLIKNKKIVVATIINRVSSENITLLKTYNIECEQLLKLDNIDYTYDVENYNVVPPMKLTIESKKNNINYIDVESKLPNPRLGLNSVEYNESCTKIAKNIITKIGKEKLLNQKILVLGTEECMYPSIVLGNYIETELNNSNVFTHSTTRSPISISKDENYPICNGYCVHSFYDLDRITYLYNVNIYDIVIIITDSKIISNEVLVDINNIFINSKKIYLVRGA